MPGITGMGTTFNLPNYVGELFGVTPEDTPFLSLIGGLTGGRKADSVVFPWQVWDMRDADAARQRLEGANAPTAEARVRSTIYNVLEIHQEAIDISYSKQSFTGQFGATGAGNTAAASVAGANPVTDEKAWQTMIALKQIARDVELGFLTGTRQDPVDNASPRKTQGLIGAITTNVIPANNAPLTEDMVLDLMQEIWSAGGISEAETRTLICNAGPKRKLTDIFISQAGQGRIEMTRNVGGVNLQTFETDFGKCNIMLDRFMPVDAVVVASLDECAPRFGEVPGKGFLFVEDLAKIGASDRAQIYGEIGLEYGVERHHGKITDLNTTGS